MKAIRNAHSFFQEEGLQIKNNHPVLPHTAVLECVCAAMKISENPVEEHLQNVEPAVHLVRKCILFIMYYCTVLL
jgi:hypothetical protein